MNIRHFLTSFAVLWLATAFGVDQRHLWSQEVSFTQEIQPLLAKRCFACHGPDKDEAGLRLHTAETATAKLESGSSAIVPGKPEASELLARITSQEDGVRMPPEGKQLTEREQTLIRRWIEQGASWKRHWAFEPLSAPVVPSSVDGDRDVHPIDAFLAAKLSQQGLQLSPAAEPRQLYRRLHFDLTGLPPTPQAMEEFLARAKVDFETAWESEIDRLLASERYGEHWARHWLDVVRYAETNSFERDGAKPHAWRYRDYVIRSFNDDKPYDQFLLEQLAGDELPVVTRDSLVATGFYRLGIWDDEPADRKLAMYEGFDDIITTVGQGLLGLTLNCSRCHDHKIDPIPTSEYYATLAFFRNLTPNGYGPHVERPLVASDSERAQFAAAEAKIREEGDLLQARLTEVENDLRKSFADLTSSRASTRDLDDLEYRFYRDTFESLPDFDKLKPETVGKLESSLIDIKLATRPDHFGFVFVGSLIVPADGEYEFVLDSDDGSRLSIDEEELIRYDGIHGVGSPKRAKRQLTQGRHPIRVDYFQGKFGQGLHLQWSGPGFKLRSLTSDEPSRKADFNEFIKSPAAERLDPAKLAQYRKIREELEANKRKKPWPDYGMCVSEEGSHAAETFVLIRGNTESTGDKVEPAFLSSLGGGYPEIVPNANANSSGRRLAFAKWLTSPDNRLTSRVFVNRIWQHHFGRGIVRSPNNFGQLGEPPTHPELLDWLANQFVQGGWRVKPIHKLILTSNAYRQVSLVSEEAAEKDPNNNLFSRFDLRRLSAEELRDSILAVNGRLNLKMYGPSVYPEISKEVLAGQSVPGKGWETSTPEDQSRRSVYIHVKRSLIVPLLASFDFPEPDTSCEARFVTTQPGQALTLLNGDFSNEQASTFAERVRREAGEKLEEQIKLAFGLALARSPEPAEIERASNLIREIRARHQLSESEALTYYCLFIFNLNEFVYLD